MDVKILIQRAIAQTASDLHLIVGIPPMVRVMGDIRPLEGLEKLASEDAKSMIYTLLSEDQKKCLSGTCGPPFPP